MLGRRVQNELRSGVAERAERRAELRRSDCVQFSEGHRKRRLQLSLGGGGDGGLAREEETEAAEGAVHQMSRNQILVGVDVGRLGGQDAKTAADLRQGGDDHIVADVLRLLRHLLLV